ncbi:MAG: RNA polymerase sigma-70 factor [Bacteroidales bacterium]
MINDLLLLKKIKEGDIGTFEYVFRLYYSPLLYYAVSITGRMDVSEEVIQELFYVLWKERENLQILRSLKGYLYGAVRNRSLQYCEHRRITENYKESLFTYRVEDLASDPQDNLEYKELEEIVKKTMDKMPERRLKIFKMHRFESRKYMEIANILSLSVKTVEAEISKALKTLRKEIEYHKSLS